MMKPTAGTVTFLIGLTEDFSAYANPLGYDLPGDTHGFGEYRIGGTSLSSPLFAGLMHEPSDYLITVCDDANERCPFVPGRHKRLHWSFEDPSRASGSDENRLATFRRVRDQIEARLADWIETR